MFNLLRSPRSSRRPLPPVRLLLLLVLVFVSAPFPNARAGDNDFAAPVLTVTSHFNGQIVNTKTIVLQGTATDAGRGGHGISSVNARGTVEGATAAGDATVNWSQTVDLNPGPNNITVYAYDNSTSQNSTSVTLTINFQPLDSLPPSLVVTSHANGAVVHSKTVVLSGTASDAGLGNNGISGVYFQGTIPGSTTTGAGTVNWSREVTLNAGPNNLYIYADDASDVKNEKLVTFTINFQPNDALPPVIQITSHTSGQTVQTSTIVLAGTATDAGRGNNGISSVYLRGTIPNTSTAGAGTVNWSRSVDLQPGANQLTVYAYDQSDVMNEAQESVTINFQPDDTQAPILEVTSHTNGQTVFSSSILLAGTATDAGRGDHGISSIYVQGTLPNVSGTGAEVVHWSKTLQLQPGKNYINVYAYDRNQFPNEATQSLIINFQAADTLGPALVITSHTDGQTVTSSSVTIAGTASDAGRGDNGISQVYLQGRIDGATAVGAGQVNWSRVVQLSPGRNFISVSASDGSEFPNETDHSITLFLQPGDALPPALQITSHTDGQVIFQNFLTLQGTASDAGRGDHGVTGVKVNFVRADNDTAVGAGVAHWSRTFALNPGKNSIYVSAQDGSEFPQETNITINVTYQLGDMTPPSLTIEQPRNNATVTTPAVLVSGSVTDSGVGGSGVTGVTVNNVAATGGVAAGSETAQWSRSVPLVLGANVVSIVAKDGSPGQNSAALTITVNYQPGDVDPPELEVTSHKNGQTVPVSTITLAGTATDANHGSGGISSVTVSGARAAGDTATGGATADWSRAINLNLGPNVISIVARDVAGNSTARTITINYDPADTLPPDLVVTSHRKQQIVSTPNILLAGTASDALQGASGIADVTVNSLPATGGTSTGAGTAQWSRSVALKAGPNLLSVVAHDNSPGHNAAVETLTITYEPVDKTPPDLVVTSHKNGQVVPGSTITLAGTASDFDLGDNGVSSVTVNAQAGSGGTATGGGTAHWSRTLVLAPGQNVISVVAADGSPAQNTTAVTLTLVYDPNIVSIPSDFCWALDGGSSGSAAGYSVALDSAGNSYVTGSFEGSAILGGTNLISHGGADIFVAKYDSTGKLLWARQAGGADADAGLGLTVDSAGACYVTGYFSGSASFDGQTVSTTGSYDLFLARYDTDGRISWVTTTGKSIGAFGRGVAVDAQGNIFVTGGFQYNAQFGDAVFSNNEFTDAFVAKYDSAGGLLWANQLGGDANDLGAGIGLDGQGGCYVTGYFTGDGFFGDELLTSSGEMDAFLARFDSDGVQLWVEQGGEAGQTQATALSVDPAGNCLVTGYLRASATFGGNNLFTDHFYDLFLVKYDPQGTVVWARNTETSNAISAGGVATDGTGNAYMTGSFYGPAEFKSLELANGSTAQIFIAKFDGDGNFLWAKEAGGTSDDIGFGIAAGAGGGCVITGTTTGLAAFGSHVLNGGTDPDMFLAGLGGQVSGQPINLGVKLLTPESLQLRFSVDSCISYRLQRSSDLLEWSNIPTTAGADGVVTHEEDISGPNTYQFFRVVSP